MERTIKVTGKGKVAVKPDLIRLLITQEDTIMSYEGAIMESADKKEALNSRLTRFGFDKVDLKTLYFDIDTAYESYQKIDKSWDRRLVGYRYTHRMKIEFKDDKELLGKILKAISDCPGQPSFSIEYTVSDPDIAKNELLRKAIEDSKIKAKVLCDAAGVCLGEIQTIDYSWGEIDFVTRPMDEGMLKCMDSACGSEGFNLDIEADDIEVTDTVTVIWKMN